MDDSDQNQICTENSRGEAVFPLHLPNPQIPLFFFLEKQINSWRMWNQSRLIKKGYSIYFPFLLLPWNGRQRSNFLTPWPNGSLSEITSLHWQRIGSGSCTQKALGSKGAVVFSRSEISSAFRVSMQGLQGLWVSKESLKVRDQVFSTNCPANKI